MSPKMLDFTVMGLTMLSRFLPVASFLLSGIAFAETEQVAANSTVQPLNVTNAYGVSGAVLWLAADSGVSIDEHSHVTSLTDRTGNFTLTSTSGPLYMPQGLNGRPVFRLNGSQSLYSPDNFGDALDRDMTFITLTLTNTASDDDSQEFSLYLGQNSNKGANRAMGTLDGHDLFDGQFTYYLSLPIVRDAYVVTAAAYNPAAGKTSFYRNGKLVTTASLGEKSSAAFGPVSDGITFGAATDPCCGWHGYIAEELVFNRQLSPQEIQMVWTALATKYALPTGNKPAASASR